MKITAGVKQAWSATSGHKLRTLLMMLGIIIGVATLTIVVSVGQGAKAEVQRRANKMWGANPIMVTAGGGAFRGEMSMSVDQGNNTLTYEDMRAIEQEVPNVRKVSPGLIKVEAPLKYRERSTNATVFGITPEFRDYRSWDVDSGEFITDEDVTSMARVCLLGQTVATELFGDADPVGQSIRIENVAFKVKGLLARKGASPMGGDMDNRLMIPITTFARRVYNVTTYLSNIVIQLKDSSRMNETAKAVTALMRQRHHITPGMQYDVGVRTPSGIVSTLSKTSRTLTLFLGLVSAVSLLVGGLVVMNIMLISVSERTREIGLRRALGARRKDILFQFLVEALLVTVIGGVIGVASGAAGAQIVRLVSKMPTEVSWQAASLGVVFSAFVGLVFGLQPARRAARLSPVEALRSE